MQLELFFFFLVRKSQMPKKFGFRKNRRGQGLVEYIVIVASVALIALVSVSMFGHKLARNIKKTSLYLNSFAK